jgi:hypothetical protein
MTQANRKPKRKVKFHKGQVVAYRAEMGQWEYDRIGDFVNRGGIQTAWLVMNTARIELRYLRPLTKREIGPRRCRQFKGRDDVRQWC